MRRLDHLDSSRSRRCRGCILVECDLLASVVAVRVDAKVAEHLVEHIGQTFGSCRLASRLTAGAYLLVAETEAGTDLKQAVGLTVGDVGQQTADEIQAVVTLAFEWLTSRALDQLVDNLRIRDAPEAHDVRR